MSVHGRCRYRTIIIITTTEREGDAIKIKLLVGCGKFFDVLRLTYKRDDDRRRGAFEL